MRASAIKIVITDNHSHDFRFWQENVALILRFWVPRSQPLVNRSPTFDPMVCLPRMTLIDVSGADDLVAGAAPERRVREGLFG